jgi:hypothetical protein
MAKQKLTFDDAVQALNEQSPIAASAVQARALQRIVWVYEWHLPGCLSESFGIACTKRDAIDGALSFAEGAEGAPRGMRADLQRFGMSNRTAPDSMFPGAVSTIARRRLADLF